MQLWTPSLQAGMADDEFSCVNFSPQKWRKDMCRNCYQPLKVHRNVKEDPGQPSLPKPSPPKPSPPKQPSPSVSPRPVTRTPSGGKSQPKVFQRFQVEKKPIIDKTVPAKERTAAPKLEGIQPGIVKKVHAIAPTLKTRDPPSLPTGATSTPQAPTATPPTPQASKATPPTPPQMSPKPVLKSKPSPPIPRRPVGYDIPARPKPPPQPKKEKPKMPPSTSPELVSKQTSRQEPSTEKPVDKKIEVNVPQDEAKELVQEPPKQELPSENIESPMKVEPSEIEEEIKSIEKDIPLVEPTPSSEPAMAEQISSETSEEVSPPVIEDEVATPDETKPVDSSPQVADSEIKVSSQELIDEANSLQEPVSPEPAMAEQSIELPPESVEEISPPVIEEATPIETETVDSSPQIAESETKDSSQEMIDEVNSLQEPVSTEPVLEEQVADQDIDTPQQNQPTSTSETATQEEPQTDTPIEDDFVIVEKGEVPEHDDIVLPEVAEAVVCTPTLVESSEPDQPPEGENNDPPAENEAENIPTEDGVEDESPLMEEASIAEGGTEDSSNITETTEEVKTEGERAFVFTLS